MICTVEGVDMELQKGGKGEGFGGRVRMKEEEGVGGLT